MLAQAFQLKRVECDSISEGPHATLRTDRNSRHLFQKPGCVFHSFDSHPAALTARGKPNWNAFHDF